MAQILLGAKDQPESSASFKRDVNYMIHKTKRLSTSDVRMKLENKLKGSPN